MTRSTYALRSLAAAAVASLTYPVLMGAGVLYPHAFGATLSVIVTLFGSFLCTVPGLGIAREARPFPLIAVACVGPLACMAAQLGFLASAGIDPEGVVYGRPGLGPPMLALPSAMVPIVPAGIAWIAYYLATRSAWRKQLLAPE